MTNNDIESIVVDSIRTGLATTTAEFINILLRRGVPKVNDQGRSIERELDNALKRLKSKELLSFDKVAKSWTYNGSSQPSAPVADSVEGSTNTADTAQETSDTMTTESSPASSTIIDDIDAKINEARSRKGSSAPADEANKRPRLSAEEKQARDAQREQERAQRKLERESARDQRRQEKESARKPAHMSKVAKAASKLPQLNDFGMQMFTELTANMGRDQVFALAQHLLHFNRSKATERALGQAVKTGDRVRITGGDPRFVGSEGVVEKAQRIRCYVKVEGAKRPVYLFTSDVQLLESVAVAANG